MKEKQGHWNKNISYYKLCALNSSILSSYLLRSPKFYCKSVCSQNKLHSIYVLTIKLAPNAPKIDSKVKSILKNKWMRNSTVGGVHALHTAEVG